MKPFFLEAQMFSIIKRIREDAKQGFKVRAEDGDLYSPLLFVGRVDKTRDLWAFVIAIGPYYAIFNKKRKEG